MSNSQNRLSQSKVVSVAARNTTVGALAQIGMAAVERSTPQTPGPTMAGAFQQARAPQATPPATAQPQSYTPPRSELVFKPIRNYSRGK